MSKLKSSTMPLSGAERRWLPWFGRTGKVAMRWSCWLNRKSYPVVEQIFEGIAHTRVNILRNWAQTQWTWLADIAENISQDFNRVTSKMLAEKLKQSANTTELFVVSTTG